MLVVMCVTSRFDLLSGNLQQTAYKQWKKARFCTLPIMFSPFFGGKGSCLPMWLVAYVAAY